jgi:capsular polysaccharide export protein
VPAYLGTGLRLLRRRAATARAAATLAALAPGPPLYLFAMQMENDFSIRAYSDFPDNDAALRLVLGSFARGAPGDARLLVKVHPLDPGLKRWDARLARLAAEAGVAARVHLLDGALPADPAMEPEILARMRRDHRGRAAGRPPRAGDAAWRDPCARRAG